MIDSESRLFSIVLTPSGSNEDLSRTARSAVAACEDAREIIIVDDGIAPTIEAEVAQLVRGSPVPVQIIRTTGVGRPRARNSAAEAASGRYLAFLDVGDVCHEDRLPAFRRAHFILRGFGWGFSGVEAIDERDRVIGVEALRDVTLRSAIYASQHPVEAIRNLPVLFTPVCGGNLVVDSALFRRVGGFRNLPQLADWDLALRLLRAREPVTIERPLLRHLIPGKHGAGEAEVARTPHPDAKDAEAERAFILDEYWRGLADDGFDVDIARHEPNTLVMSLSDPDSRAAATAALWGLDQIRRVPPLYRAVRQVAQSLRGVGRVRR